MWWNWKWLVSKEIELQRVLFHYIYIPSKYILKWFQNEVLMFSIKFIYIPTDTRSMIKRRFKLVWLICNSIISGNPVLHNLHKLHVSSIYTAVVPCSPIYCLHLIPPQPFPSLRKLISESVDVVWKVSTYSMSLQDIIPEDMLVCVRIGLFCHIF